MENNLTEYELHMIIQDVLYYTLEKIDDYKGIQISSNGYFAFIYLSDSRRNIRAKINSNGTMLVEKERLADISTTGKTQILRFADYIDAKNVSNIIFNKWEELK